MKITICHLYPDVLNLYGDQGNIICLKKRLEWRGIDSEIISLPIGTHADFSSFDIVFVGGGQDFEQGVLLNDLSKGKATDIRTAINDDKVFLAICGGYQMLGQYYITHDGIQCDFIGALDLHTIGSAKRMIGNLVFECTASNGGTTAVAFENHSGKTYLGNSVLPLARVISGFGNNGEDGYEGARYKNVFCSYGHGPLLPRNPELADLIISTALNRKYPNFQLPCLDDSMEIAAKRIMLERISK